MEYGCSLTAAVWYFLKGNRKVWWIWICMILKFALRVEWGERRGEWTSSAFWRWASGMAARTDAQWMILHLNDACSAMSIFWYRIIHPHGEQIRAHCQKIRSWAIWIRRIVHLDKGLPIFAVLLSYCACLCSYLVNRERTALPRNPIMWILLSFINFLKIFQTF